MVSIVRKPGMTDAQYRAARKSASDFTRRQKQRQRARNKKSPNMIYDVSNQPSLRKISPPTTNFVKPKRPSKAPRKGRVQLVPQRPSTLTPIQLEQQKRFQKELQKQRDIFNKNISKQVAEANRQLARERLQKKQVKQTSPLTKKPTDTQIKQNQHNRKMAELAGIDTSSAIAQSRKKVKRQPSVTSQYRGRSGKKKYNQAAYFAGLGVNPNTKQNQGIYKPYANGGGVRKPKYKE